MIVDKTYQTLKEDQKINKTNRICKDRKRNETENEAKAETSMFKEEGSGIDQLD